MKGPRKGKIDIMAHYAKALELLNEMMVERDKLKEELRTLRARYCEVKEELNRLKKKGD